MIQQHDYLVYGIVAVCYDDSKDRIVEVKMRGFVSGAPNGPDRLLSEERQMNRAEVIFGVGMGTVFYTFRMVGNVAVRGAKVELVKIGEEAFLRTVPNQIRGDNLGELPMYNCMSRS